MRRVYVQKSFAEIWNIMSQVMIFVFGVTAVWLTQSPDLNMQRYACLYGMASQPFFIYVSVYAKQWGVLAITLVYAASWARGVNTYWLGWF